MIIEVRCPNGHVLRVKDKHAGKVGSCPRCSAPVKVPMVNYIRTDTPRRPQAVSDYAMDESVLQQELHSVGHDDALDSSSSSFSLQAGKDKLCLGCCKMVSPSFSVCTRCGTPVPAYHHLTARREGETIVVTLTKSRIHDEAEVKQVSDELCSVADRQRDMVLNMFKVTNVSSLMLGKLVMLQKRVQQNRKRLKLCEAGAEVRQVLETTKLDHLLRISESEQAALASLTGDVATGPARS